MPGTWIQRTAALLLWAGAAGLAVAECPEPSESFRRLGTFDLRGTSRVARFSGQFPGELREKAFRRPGEATATFSDKRGYGAMLVELPVERLWLAVNDEDHHTLDENYIPVRHSEVIAGTPRGESRLLFQYFQRWGIGRWWASNVRMNRELFESSQGKLWEVFWEDRIATVDAGAPPIEEVAAKVRALRKTYGSWLFVPLGDRCTYVEYYNFSDPGGGVSALQWLFAAKGIRDAMRGLARMADEHVTQPHPGVQFVRPDGTRVEATGDRAVAQDGG